MPFSVRERCGHCRQVADIPFVSTQLFEERHSGPTLREGQGDHRRQMWTTLRESDLIDAYAVAVCPLCARPNLILYKTERQFLPNIQEALGDKPGLFGGSSIIKILTSFPNVPSPDTHSSWPPLAAELFRDAQLMLEDKRSPSIIITTCRSILDVATKALDGQAAILSKRIDELRERGIITQSLSDWAHELRLDGNTAVHEIEGTEETARDLIAFLRVFMQVAFTLPADIATKRARTKALD